MYQRDFNRGKSAAAFLLHICLNTYRMAILTTKDAFYPKIEVPKCRQNIYGLCIFALIVQIRFKHRYNLSREYVNAAQYEEA